MGEITTIRFPVDIPAPTGPVADVRRLVLCIPGAELLQSQDASRVAARLRLGSGGVRFSRSGTVTLHSEAPGMWTLRLEPSPDGPAAASAELVVGPGAMPGDGVAWMTITPGSGLARLAPSEARRVEITARRVVEQFFRNLDAALAPASATTVSPVPETGPAYEADRQQAGSFSSRPPLPAWERRATVGYIAGAFLVIAGLVAGLRAIRGGRRV